ncbi:MAG: DUF3105 domain-containing protein [Actinomycetota bacterium]|nr:DUF3105 domain-containing protein [Actinomycetota bacterium]
MASTKNSARSGGKPAGRATGRPAGSAGGRKGAPPRGRNAVAPIKPGLPWGLIAIGLAIALFAGAVIGYAVYQVHQSNLPAAKRIAGLITYPRKTLSEKHVTTPVKYKQTPPIGGAHNATPQDCMGDVYTAPIANEHAVHSLEHGAVWITYDPKLPKSEVAKLASKVRGQPYMMLSPYPGQPSPISLQAWGYQVRVKKASDKRIALFISAFRDTGAPESHASCATGYTKIGSSP